MCISAKNTCTYNTDMNWYIHAVSVKHTYRVCICIKIYTRYRQVHIGYAQCISHIHTPVSACICLYLYVSHDHRSCIQCICVHMSDTNSPHTCRYKQICTHEGSSYLYAPERAARVWGGQSESMVPPIGILPNVCIRRSGLKQRPR